MHFACLERILSFFGHPLTNNRAHTDTPHSLYMFEQAHKDSQSLYKQAHKVTQSFHNVAHEDPTTFHLAHKCSLPFFGY